MYNLVDNAIKFSDKGEKIEIETALKENKKIVNKCKRPMVEELVKKMKNIFFHRFYKVDSSRGKDKTGSGLGVVYSERIFY